MNYVLQVDNPIVMEVDESPRQPICIQNWSSGKHVGDLDIFRTAEKVNIFTNPRCGDETSGSKKAGLAKNLF